MSAKHKPHPVSQIELARRAGRSRSRISEACREGGPIAAALMDGGRIDAAHPDVARWAEKRRIDPRRLFDPDSAVAPPSTKADPHGPAIESVMMMRLCEIEDRWGALQGFSDWLDARKTAEEIRRLELANEQTLGRLIERELVRTHVFGAIDGQNRRLLGETAKTIARRLYPLAKSGATLEAAETLVRDLIASQLRVAKETAIRVLGGHVT